MTTPHAQIIVMTSESTPSVPGRIEAAYILVGGTRISHLHFGHLSILPPDRERIGYFC